MEKGDVKKRERGSSITISVIVMFVTISLIPVMPVSATNEIYFKPDPVGIPTAGEYYVEVLINATDPIDAWSTEIEFDPDCINITDCSYGPQWPLNTLWNHFGNRIRVWNSRTGCSVVPNGTLLVNLTVQCKKSGCESPLNFTGIENVWRYIGCSVTLKYHPAVWRNTTVICGAARVPEVKINEFMSDPLEGADWVELYNPSADDVDLTGWTLKDSTSVIKDLNGSRIPAGGYLVVKVDNRLNKEGDSIILLKEGVVVDNVTYGSEPGNAPVPPKGKSVGRYPDGKDTDVDSEDFVVFDVPTPGAKNVRMPLTPLTPFLIFGAVYSESVKGKQISDVHVTVTNLNTSEKFVAEIAENYYQIVLSSKNVHVGDVLHFEACDDGNCVEFNTTVSDENMSDGGLFFINITIALLPDLNVSAIEAPQETYVNTTNVVNATIANIGSADAGAFNVSLIVNGVVSGEKRIYSLAAGETKEVSFVWTPKSAGEYELCVIADSNNEIKESNEMNNELCTTVKVAEVPKPDLKPVIKVPSHVYVNESTDINATILNVGNADAGAFNVSLIINGDVRSKTKVDSLSAGGSVNVKFEWTPLETGAYEICVVADCDGDIDESNETNNESCKTVIVEEVPKPDITVMGIGIPPMYANMSSVIEATVANTGDADAGAFNVSLLVNGDVVDAVHLLSLNAGSEEKLNFIWKPESAGEYELCVVADSNNEIDEYNEDNNIRCENVTVGLLRGVRVSIGEYSAAQGDEVKVPITLHGIRDYGTGTICVEYDPAVVHISNISSSSHSTVVAWNLDNAIGSACISAWNLTGASGDIVFAYVTLKAVGSEGSTSPLILRVSKLADIHYKEIPAFTENGSFMIRENEPPIVGNPMATPCVILNDNGRARVPGTNITRLNVSVSDASGVLSVTINLTPILGSGHDCVPMTLIEGDSKNGIWSVVTNASYDPGVNKTHCLRVNATDIFGNSNTKKCILLTVLRRGDVIRDNRVDMADALRIARYTVDLEPEPDALVADVVPADEHDGVDMLDALYIARYTVGLEHAP